MAMKQLLDYLPAEGQKEPEAVCEKMMCLCHRSDVLQSRQHLPDLDDVMILFHWPDLLQSPYWLSDLCSHHKLPLKMKEMVVPIVG